MGHSQAGKADSRERILQAASLQLRESGPESVVIAKLMHRARLTHGEFYGHFKSRADLLTQALKRALDDESIRARSAEALARDFPAFVRQYLSRSHRDARSTGCGIAALVSDIGRAGEPSRTVMQDYVEARIAGLAGVLGEDGDAKAIVAVSAMVGGLALARITTDPKKSDEILKAVENYVIALQ